MKIKYEITKDDYLKFNMFHLENSKGVKKELIMHRFVIPVLLLGAGYAFHVLAKAPLLASMLLALSGAVAWSILYPEYYKKNAMKNVDKMLSRGVQSTSITKHTLSVKDEGIIASSPVGQSVNKWSEVKKFSETPEHLFIYITDKVAHVIPKKAFKNKDEETEFIDIVRKNIK